MRNYKGLLIAAELTAVRFHDLRHTAAAVAGDAGMEEYMIAAMLGHRKGNVTPKHAKATVQQMRTIILTVEQKYTQKTEKEAQNEAIS